MRPQRKPFVVEIKKAKQFSRKPASAGAGRIEVATPTVAERAAKAAFRSEGCA